MIKTKMQKTEVKDIEELVIAVDLVNGFVKEGALADPYIQHIIPAAKNYMQEALTDEHKAVAVIRENHTKEAMEFKNYPPHCLAGTWEAALVIELVQYEPYCYEFFKNSTCAMWAPGFLDFIKEVIKNPKFRKITIVGCCTDICVMDVAIPLKKLCDELDIAVDVIVPKEAVETYETKPNVYDGDGKLMEAGIHDRQEYNNMAFKFMMQAGIKVEEPSKVKVYN